MKAILLVCATLYLSPAMAQSGFRKGFLLSTKGDTIPGFIQYSGNSKHNQYCSFRKTTTQPDVHYKPGEINGFRFENDQYYVTKSVGKSSDVFLEVLVKGNITLYRFNKIYYIEKGDSLLFELSDEKDVVEMHGQRIKKKSKNFARLLSVLMADCPKVLDQIPVLDLKEKLIIDLVQRYNQCIGSTSTTYRSKWPGKQKRQPRPG